MKISKLNVNIGVNFLGTIWSIISVYFFLPYYLKYLGEETYGLIMFSLTIQAVIMLMDAGFSSTLRRELAWTNTDKSKDNKLSLFYTIEAFYLLIFLFIGLIGIFFSDWLSTNWFVNTTLSTSILKTSIILMFVNAILQIQTSLYTGALLALGFQIKSNLLQFLFTLFKNGFVIFVIIFYNSPIYFLAWQLIVTMIYLIVQRLILIEAFKSLSINNGEVDFGILKKVWSVSSLFLLISIFSTINFQIDKIIISKMMNLKYLGYYNTMYSLGQITVSICGPIATALTPLIIRSYSKKENDVVASLFHKYAKMSTILSFALGCTLMFENKSIIKIWTGNENLVLETASSIKFIILAGMMLACQVVPYTLGIASASMKPIIFTCLLNIILTIPAYIYLGDLLGLQGFAMVWGFSNILMLLVNVYFFTKNTIPRHYFKWLVFDFLLPSLFAFFIIISLVFIRPHFLNNFMELLSISGVFIISFFSLVVIFFLNEVKFIFNNLSAKNVIR